MELIFRESKRFWAYLWLVLIGLVSVFPFYWMVSSSLKTSQEIMALPPQWWPAHPTIQAYLTVFHVIAFARAMGNSFIVTGTATFGILATSIMAGYVFAKYRFRGKEVLFTGVLATMMVPSFVTLVPLYYFFNRLNLIDSYTALILPNIGNAFGIFLMRQFIAGIPQELIEAARIDGASEWRILWRVITPLLGPAIATLGLFAFVFQWNRFLWPLTIVNTPKMYTVVLALNSLESYTSSVQFANVVMAGAVVGILPSVLLFLWLQKYFIRGVAMTGIKG
ncbi:MAG: carbohydrate ABC transporter permease [Sulfobacillus sp.]